MIGTEGNVIVTRWGQIGGAMQETRDVVKAGKNTGRSNATTPEQQAEAEAHSKWEHKLKKGYVQDLSAARAGEVDDIIQGGIFPMLAERMDKHGAKLKYPCLAQPKFDGHRCIAMVDKQGKCTLWTRSRKPIISMPHIVAAIEGMGLQDITLDGELYNHDYRDRFEDLTSFIRNNKPIAVVQLDPQDEAFAGELREEVGPKMPGPDVVQYHVYDVVNLQQQWFRTKLLHSTLVHGSWGSAKLRHPSIVYVETVEVANEEELMDAFGRFLAAGYEGAMARNRDGLYQTNSRSTDLIKIKEFVDDEFEVTGVEEGRGKLAGHAGAFFCKTKSGSEFKAKLMGELEGLRKYFEDPSLAIGKQLTVKYQGLTKKNGVPRFPVAMRFRED